MQKIQRTKGETRTHLYDYSLGYPIRVCNWSMPEYDFIDNDNAPLCKNCLAYQQGKSKICFAPKLHSQTHSDKPTQ